KQKTAYELATVTGVQTCALPIWILFLVSRHRPGLKRHPTDRARPRLRPHDLGMHRAGVLNLRGRQRTLRLQRHAAARTRPRTDLPHFRTHWTNVVALVLVGLPGNVYSLSRS